MQLVRFAPGYKFKPFDCGDLDLNEFLLRDALMSFSELLTVTFILESDDKIIAYFSLLNDKITYEEAQMSNRKWKKFSDQKKGSGQYKTTLRQLRQVVQYSVGGDHNGLFNSFSHRG